MRSAIVMALVAVLSTGAWAGETKESERQGLAEQYFRVSGFEDMYNDKRKVEEMISSQMYTLEQSVTAGMSAAQAADYRRYMAEMRPDINRIIGEALSAMRPEMIRVVAETYTADELRALVAFYSSENGQRIVAKTPELMNQMMAVGGRHMGGMMQNMQQLVAAKLQQAEKPAAPAKGK